MMLSFDEYRNIVNSHLVDYIPAADCHSIILTDSMKYSLTVGGKRLRPVLLLAAYELAENDIDKAIPFAAAVEYIHTYSLIHDDLPAIDNDDLRRGRQTNHRVFGEDIAILAGDGLLNTAAEILTGEILKYSDDPAVMINAARAANEIISRAGVRGMIGGQTADVKGTCGDATPDLVRFIDAHKTGDLITAPVRAGLMLAGAGEDLLSAMTEFSMNIGIAFQVLDDILDYEGSADLIGKNVGKDKELGKCNYVCVHGVEAARTELHRLTSDAKAAISQYGDSVSFFTDLADRLEVRRA